MSEESLTGLLMVFAYLACGVAIAAWIFHRESADGLDVRLGEVFLCVLLLSIITLAWPFMLCAYIYEGSRLQKWIKDDPIVFRKKPK